MIYLDHNATTPLDNKVKRAMIKAFKYFGNPSSSHLLGTKARFVIEKARMDIADLFGIKDKGDIVFTSGGTESNNLALIGIAYRYTKGHIISSEIEHPSVINPLKWLQSKGFDISLLPVNSDGMINPDDVKKCIKKNTILITIMHSNNETGVLQPISEIGHIAHQFGILFHTDAAQSIGKINVDIDNIDIMTIAPHKFYGPKGIGAIYIKKKTRLNPILFGAGQERGLRPGTENIVNIIGFKEALKQINKDLYKKQISMARFCNTLFDLLEQKLDIKLNGHRKQRLPNTLNISIKGILSEDIIYKLKNKVAFSSGSACHSGKRTPSTILKAMGITDSDALSSIRLSVGKDNTLTEIKLAASMIIKECL